MPLANLIELKTFKLGEIILREGDKAREFSIITKGRGKIVKEEIIVRDTEVLGVHKSSKKKRLKFGKDNRKFNTLFFNPPPAPSPYFHSPQEIDIIKLEEKSIPSHYYSS